MDWFGEQHLPVVQWIERRVSNPLMGVQFPPGRQLTKPAWDKKIWRLWCSSSTTGCGPVSRGANPLSLPNVKSL